MSLENDQNNLFLALGKGNALAISLGAQNCERTCSTNNHRTNKTWIPPPGKSNRGLNTCCPQNHIKACLILQLIENENGLGQVPYSSREIKQNKNAKGIGNSSHKQEQTVQEFDKMAQEHEMKQKTFLKYVDGIKEELDELRGFVKKLENNQRNLFHRNSQFKYNNEEQINELLGISSVSEIDSGNDRLNRKESFSQPVAESTRLTSKYKDKNFKHLLKKDPSSSSLSTNEIPTIPLNQSKYIDQFKEHLEPESFVDVRHCDASTELVKKLADNTMKMKFCIDLVNQQDKVVNSKQKKYIQAAETLQQNQLNIIKRLYKVIDSSTSTSGSSENRVARESKKPRPTKKESRRKSNNNLKDIKTVNGKKETKDKNRKTSKDERFTKANLEPTGKRKDSLPSFHFDMPNPRPFIPIPKRRDDISKYSSINESRRRQDHDETSDSNLLVISRQAENLNRSGSNHSNRNSNLLEGINDSNNSIKTSQASRKPAKAGRTASKLSEIPRESDSYFSSEDSVLHKTNSYDYVCKTIIKQIMRRYPPSATYGYNAIDGLAPPMTDIIRKVDQIVNDIMPSMGGERNAARVQPGPVEERGRASVEERYIQPTDEPLNNIQQNERQSNQNLMNIQDLQALERTQNRDGRLQNRRPRERPDTRNSIDNHENRPRDERGAPDRTHRSSINRDAADDQEDLPPHDRPPNRRPSERPDTRNSIDNHENRPRDERGAPDRTHRSSINRDAADDQEDLPPHDRPPNRILMGNQRNLPQRERDHDRRSSANPLNRDVINNQRQNIPPHDRPPSRTSVKRLKNGRDDLSNDRQRVSNGRHSKEKQEKDSKRMSKNENHPELEVEEGDLSAEELPQSRSQAAAEGVDLPQRERDHGRRSSANSLNRDFINNQRQNIPPHDTPPSRTSPKRLKNGRDDLSNDRHRVSNGRHSKEKQEKDSKRMSKNENHPELELEEGDLSAEELPQSRSQAAAEGVDLPQRERDHDRRSSANSLNRDFRNNQRQNIPPHDRPPSRTSPKRMKNGREEGDLSAEELPQSRSQAAEGVDQEHHYYTSTPKGVKPTKMQSFEPSRIEKHIPEIDEPQSQNRTFHQSRSSHSFTRLDSVERCNCIGPCTNPRHMGASVFEDSDSNLRHLSNERRDRTGREIGYQSRSSHSFTRMDSVEICNCVGSCNNPRHVSESKLEDSDNKVEHISNENRDKTGRSKASNQQSWSSNVPTGPNSIIICDCDGPCNNPTHIPESMLEDSNNNDEHASTENRDRTGRQSQSSHSTRLSSMEMCDCDGPCNNPMHFRESLLRDVRYLAGYNPRKRGTKTKPKHFKELFKKMPDSDAEDRNHSKELEAKKTLQGGSLSKSSASLEQMECNCVGRCKNPRHLKGKGSKKSDSVEWQCSCEGKCRNLRHILRPSTDTISSSSSLVSSGRCSCEGRCRNLRHLLRSSDSRTSSSSRGFPYCPHSSSEQCDCPESCTNPFHEQSSPEISNRRSGEDNGSSEQTHKSPSMSKERHFKDSGFESDKSTPFKPKHDKFDTSSEQSHGFEDSGYASDKSSSGKWKPDKSGASSKRSHDKDSGYVSDKSALSKQSHDFKDSGYVSDKSSSFPEKHDKSSEHIHDFEDSGYASNKSTSSNQKRNILSKRWSDSYQDQLSPEFKREDSGYSSDKSRRENSLETASKHLEDPEKNPGSSTKQDNESTPSLPRRNKLQTHQEHDKDKTVKEEFRSKSHITIRSTDVEPFVELIVKIAEDHEENNTTHPQETQPNPRHSPEEDKASKQEMSKEYIQESDSKVGHGPRHTSTPKKERPLKKESLGMSKIEKHQSSSKPTSGETSDDSKHGKSSEEEMSKEYIPESDSKVGHGPRHTSTPKKERPVKKESLGMSKIEKH
ncbi:hypothetical protein JTE90_016117 [Oedothorax gibbosus]|uniref:Uncharacterized protein n=1 Tax=Oedothorax gibbosus TaxID=931172 RepID=A0AAV6U4K2_9ARAC|nr:hypothetical protein JTE90_016117 [Oedothorax gibbosus]